MVFIVQKSRSFKFEKIPRRTYCLEPMEDHKTDEIHNEIMRACLKEMIHLMQTWVLKNNIHLNSYKTRWASNQFNPFQTSHFSVRAVAYVRFYTTVCLCFETALDARKLCCNLKHNHCWGSQWPQKHPALFLCQKGKNVTMMTSVSIRILMQVVYLFNKSVSACSYDSSAGP